MPIRGRCLAVIGSAERSLITESQRLKETTRRVKTDKEKKHNAGNNSGRSVSSNSKAAPTLSGTRKKFKSRYRAHRKVSTLTAADAIANETAMTIAQQKTTRLDSAIEQKSAQDRVIPALRLPAASRTTRRVKIGIKKNRNAASNSGKSGIRNSNGNSSNSLSIIRNVSSSRHNSLSIITIRNSSNSRNNARNIIDP